MLCDKKQSTQKNNKGYVLPLALSLILLTSIASASAIHTANTQIRSMSSEKQYLQAFHLAEVQLVTTEKLLLAGIQPITQSNSESGKGLVIEIFKPKYFRSKTGVLSQHYKITVNSQLNPLSIESTIRIDEITKLNKNKSSIKQRSLQRLSWKLSSQDA
jgi:Tfp pilus assembly protein PilX